MALINAFCIASMAFTSCTFTMALALSASKRRRPKPKRGEKRWSRCRHALDELLMLGRSPFVHGLSLRLGEGADPLDRADRLARTREKSSPSRRRRESGPAESGSAKLSRPISLASKPSNSLLQASIMQAHQVRSAMRIHILHAPTGDDVDGVDLSHFQVGSEYNVTHTFAAMMVAEGWAEPLPVDAPQPPAAFGPDDPFTMPVLDRSTPPKLVKEQLPAYLAPDKAADMSRRRRKKR